MTLGYGTCPREKCKLFENILLLKLGHKKDDRWTRLGILVPSTHEFSSCECSFGPYCFSCSLLWIASLPNEDRSIGIYYSCKSRLRATSTLTFGPGVEQSESPESSFLVWSLPSSFLQGWDLRTDYNHLLKGYYSDQKNEKLQIVKQKEY